MARVSSKHLVFMVFVFLCFITTVNGARRMRTALGKGIGAEKAENYVLAPLTAEEETGVKQNGEDDLVTVDYTPARKKPPIHN